MGLFMTHVRVATPWHGAWHQLGSQERGVVDVLSEQTSVILSVPWAHSSWTRGGSQKLD